MSTKSITTLVLAVVFLLGSALIVYNGRPVMKLKNQVASATATNQIAPVAMATQEHEAGEEIENEQEEDAPVVQPAQQTVHASSVQQPTNTTPTQPTQSQTQTAQKTTSGPLSFSMAEVASHSTRSDCWSAINGSVYDLTSFVNRHPGGASRIISLCGIDGSTAYNRQHERSRSAQSMLGLLKIGSLSS